MTARRVEQQLLVLLAGAALALACGYAIDAHTALALLLAGAIVAVVGLLLVGARAYALALVLVAVAPWYPFVQQTAGPPIVSQKVLCAAVLAAPVVPWLWSIGAGPSGRRPSALVGLYGLLFVGLTLAVHDAIGALKPMISSETVGLLAGGVIFIAARRFPDARAWSAAATVGATALVLMGFAAAAMAPGQRIGAFTGYPITYGALLIGLLPLALVWTARRSYLLAGVLGAASCTTLILSESRSSWIAAAVVMLVVIALLLRQGQWRALGAVTGLVLVTGTLIASTGSLNGVVERKLSPDVAQTDSVTHRAWSYGYAVGQIRERPLFGAGAPGYAADQAAEETNIGALDNGYLSVSVDAGVFGFLQVIVPIAIALALAVRWCWRRETPTPEIVALMLGVLALAVVTMFYDSFYWAQISMLIFAMGGTLSAQAPEVRGQLRRNRRRRVVSSPGTS